MKWQKVHGCGFLASFFLAAVFLFGGLTWVGAQATPTSEAPLPMPALLNPDGTVNWQALDQASQQIWHSAQTQAQTQSDLSSSLEGLQKQYTKLLSSIQATDQAKDKVVHAALNKYLWWQRVTLVTAGAFMGYLIDKWPGAAIGAGSGAVVDAGLEISAAIKVRL